MTEAWAPGPTDDVGVVARTRRLDHDPDLLAIAGGDGLLFARDRCGFAGRGTALRLPRAQADGVLRSIPTDDDVRRSGTGPVAFGALPFLPDAPAELLVPDVTVGRDADGTRWITTVVSAGPGADERHDALAATTLAHLPAAPTPADGPGSFEVRSARPPEAWTQAVATATEHIRAGQLDKVVLAREITVTADRPIPIATVLTRLAAGYPGCFLYLVEGFCGASPELLVGRSGDVVRAQPMAGTVPRSGDPAVDARRTAALLASATYRHEHQVTIDAVHDALLAFSSYVDYEPEPSVVPLANVSHLATSVEGRLSHPPASVLELVAALHPTPAICGRPRDAALALIASLEELDRDRYAGAVGWTDGQGNGQWAVSIRGAAIDGNVARVIGGNGIVGDSDPPTELTETRAKLQAMLGAIVRP
ncbi:isochorismate synthase [Aquihabitans sp. McL0605]|uniref:isochorismate synthase n=1 Tax=Aquihabitans sp. McL0605 TaxID=3415671 RepID=UPI003CEC2710